MSLKFASLRTLKDTAEYFRKLNLSEGGTFGVSTVECKDSSFIKLELMFGGACYDENSTLPCIDAVRRPVALALTVKNNSFDFCQGIWLR